MIVLASASPRRRELLRAAGLTFDVVPSGVDESYGADLGARDVALELASRKARDVAGRRARVEETGPSPGPTWVIGADTVVALGGANAGSASVRHGGAGGAVAERLLGKPRDEAQAGEMLRALSDTRHRVITGVCVIQVQGGGERAEAETTWVTMRSLSTAERAAYVASGEWRDKAGGYAIQETADRFVTQLNGGGFDNVVGLPVALCLRLLAESGAPLP